MRFADWIPDRKFLAGGIGGVFAWWLLGLFPEMDRETALQIGGGIGLLLFYVVPQSARDILRRLDPETAALYKEKRGIDA